MKIPHDASGDVQQAFHDVAAALEPLTAGKSMDARGRTIVNVGEGVNSNDAVNVQQLQRAVAAVTVPRQGAAAVSKTGPTSGALAAAGSVRVGLYLTRGAALAHPAEVFIASDLQNVMWLSDGTNWHYLTGVFADTLSPDHKPGVLTAEDVGFRFFATDFNRTYVWDGAAWGDSPDSEARAKLVFFANPPIPAAGWHLVDGSTVNRSTSTGGVTSVVLDDLIGSMGGPQRFLRAAGGYGATGGDAPNHTHVIDPPNTTSSGPNTNDTNGPTPSTTDADGGSGATVQSGAGATVAAHPHTHDYSHIHQMSDHTHDVNIASFDSAGPSGSGGDDALPPYVDARLYYRL